MMFRRICALMLCVAPAASFAASREIQELQRDVGLLQEQVKALQRSQDQSLAALTTLVQQALDAANKANTSVAVIQSSITQNLRDQEGKVVAPVVNIGQRMDQMSNDFRTLQQSVADLTGLINRMQAQLNDVSTAVKTMQAPAAPPPPAGSPSGPGASLTPGAASGPPPMSASDLYTNAYRDRAGGKADLALQEFSDYLKWYGNTDLAPNAQYYIGDIHFTQGRYDDALREFDLVLEKYPDNNKTADALYMKGMTLLKLQRKTDGASEFKQLISRFPTNDLSKKACHELTTLGLRCGSARAAASKASRRKK
ncbi:MAG TPA: tetratricopeptide repeat protein [Bryobacteraceae bacterium]|nr:tetratricopeptide repeat protein [Bryobacteraceae bacterium]